MDWENFLCASVVRLWYRLPRAVVESSFLEEFRFLYVALGHIG